MKRFFLVFSIIMTVFLALTAGSLAALEYGAITTYDLQPPFVGGWGITTVPFHGSVITYPDGDVFFVRQAPAGDIQPGNVILFIVEDGSGIMSGYVIGREEATLLVEGANGRTVTVPAGSLMGRYDSRIKGFAILLGVLKSPVSIVLFAIVLIASIVLWRVLPSGRHGHASLSPSDGEISSVLY